MPKRPHLNVVPQHDEATSPAVRPAEPARAPAEDTPLSTSELRGRFAVSLCRAHRIAAEDGSTPCQDGVPCNKKDACLDMADKTLTYARDLKNNQIQMKDT